ncbi:hypothetical protein [Tepidimicrobium xylanilyticum]
MYPQDFEQRHPAVPPLYPMDPCRPKPYETMPYDPMPYERMPYESMPYEHMPYMPCPMMDPMLRDCIRVCMMQCGRYSSYYYPMEQGNMYIDQSTSYYMEDIK